MLRLEFPTISHEASYLEMMAEWRSVEPDGTSPGRLFVGDSYAEFLMAITKDLTESSRGVNATLLFLLNEEDKILGALQIRHHINHPDLMETGGHIGYGIRPFERGKGYATKMLELGLVEATVLGLEKVLLTCDEDNIGSRKVIEVNGGIFERYAENKEPKSRRYWINTSKSKDTP